MVLFFFEAVFEGTAALVEGGEAAARLKRAIAAIAANRIATVLSMGKTSVALPE
jgi:hypothetical protein